MNDKDWKEYRRQADNGESPEVQTWNVLGLLDERDALRVAAKGLLAMYVCKRGVWYHNITGSDMDAQQQALTNLAEATRSRQ